jgi:hypothetical protein
MHHQVRTLVSAWLFLAAVTPVRAQAPPDPGPVLAAQRKAMAVLSDLDGEWRGTARHTLPDGHAVTLTQTERVGPMLGGTLRVVEGRGYAADSTLAFQAFAVIAFDPATGRYTMRSHAMGRTGEFTLTPTSDGFRWEIPAGPMTLRYTAVVAGGVWRETGVRVMPSGETVTFHEMELRRVGDTEWPAGAAVGMR